MELFTFHVARSEAQLDIARSLRDAVYRPRLGLHLSDIPGEAQRDQMGHVFLLRRNAEPVGTVRIVPTSCPATELRQLGPLPQWAARDLCCGEVGRVATLKSGRTNAMSIRLLLVAWSARWVLRHSPLLRYVAYSRLALLPLWRQVGAVDTGVRFAIPDRGEAQYAVITGELADVASTTRSIDDETLEQVVTVS